ncbi:hypothetical protein EFP68_09470 [Lactobacillus helveticus]|uniref:C39 family peptidase n=1 Tax=Lactobacillus helveticus TaxID=1587 RepID=UPI001C1DD017|nr:C39 family peptidase [Lactobacillus helveticus]MBU5981210.1 C39 family peptidase [Lactobacillus helveticus]MCT3414717.1 hypothetical protein [Lactobacillus helveticus]
MKGKILFISIISCFLLTGFSTTVKADETDQSQTSQINKSDSTQDSGNKQNQTNQNSNNTPVKNNNSRKTVNGNTYYLKNGSATKGFKKINGYWYLFNKNGIMLKDVRKIPHTKHYNYFDQLGRRRMKNTSTKKAYYWINKKGQITGIKNNAKVICQRPQMPTGCEITAVTMMLNFAGKKVSKYQAAKVMPRSSNPNKGFVGSPYKKFPLGFWVAPGGVKPVVQHYLGKSKIMTNCSINAIKQKLLRSHLVVVWVGMFDGISNHAITLTGYHGNTLYYNDPWTGTKRKISVTKFKIHWALDGHRAISY